MIFENLSMEEKEIIGMDCSICLMEYEKKDCIIKLFCSHCYHHDCIITWVRRNNVCPICRMKINQLNK